MNLTDALTIGGPIGIAVAVLIVLGYVWKKLHPVIRKVEQFSEDWFGEPARPGVAARPGVMERIAKLNAELHPNGGSSLRDAVDRTEVGLGALRNEVAEVKGAQESWQVRSYSYLKTVRESGIELPPAPGEGEMET